MKSPITIFQCDDESITLPGGYLWIYIVQYKRVDLSNKILTYDCYNVRVCENDERGDVCSKDVYIFEEAEKLVSDILARAPINMQTLINTMGFKWE